MDSLLYGITIFMVASCFMTRKNRENFQRSMRLYKGLRPRHFGWAALSITSVIAVGALLWNLVPPLRWGWWSTLGGSGTAISPGDESSTFSTIFSALIILVLLSILPYLAHYEEEIFRKNAENRSTRANLLVSLGFGLMHLLMGIPIAAALALTVGGMVFNHVYLRTFHRTFAKQSGNSYEDAVDSLIKQVSPADGLYHRQSFVVTLAVREMVEAPPLKDSSNPVETALNEATRAHLAHNLVIFSSVGISLAASLLA